MSPRAVIVTGGGTGIGAAVARALTAAGDQVAIFGRRPGPLRAVAAATGAVDFECDISDAAQVSAAVRAVVERFGGLDVWICNAAVSPEVADVAATDPDVWREILDVNLTGVYLGARAATGVMGPGGRIIVTGSVLGDRPRGGLAAYSASKGGVVGLTLPAARDLAQHKVRVNTIAPGLFFTPLLMGLSEEARQSLGAQVPHPARLGDAAEYGNLAVHIVENAMLNGETIRLDGAIRMAPR